MRNYPNQHDVEIAQCEIDPGNVFYTILEEDGSIKEHHDKEEGIIDIDDNLGPFCYGDL